MTNAIVDYRIISAPEYYTVTDAVRRAMEEGWQPLGGVGVAIARHPSPQYEYRETFQFAQAVVKYAS